MERYRIPDSCLVLEHANGVPIETVDLYGSRDLEQRALDPLQAVPLVDEVLVVPSVRCGMRVYDPFLYHTAVCASRVTLTDGFNGKLYYRGYDVEDLVQCPENSAMPHASFEEVSFLLINGVLPDRIALEIWRDHLLSHTFLHEDILAQLRTFRHDASPMGSLISAMSALSTFHPEANPSLRGSTLYKDSEIARNKQVYRLLGKSATIAACVWRAKIGRSFVAPCSPESDEGIDVNGDLQRSSPAHSYVANFLYMLDGFDPHPALVGIVERAWIVLADDGMNCAAGVLRHVASSGADPYVCVATAMAATYGQRISGIGEAVVRTLEQVEAHLGKLCAADAEDRYHCTRAYVTEHFKLRRKRLPGFGHVHYKKYDPRARVLQKLCVEARNVLHVAEPLLDMAQLLEP